MRIDSKSRSGLRFTLILLAALGLTTAFGVSAEAKKFPSEISKRGIPGDILTPLCSEGSHNPACWSNWHGLRVLKMNLKCGPGARIELIFDQGEGPGCGESGRYIIDKQAVNHAAGTIDISTSYVPPKRKPGACHYYGPIGSYGTIEPIKGQWTVIVRGKEIGTFTYAEETSFTEKSSSSISSCELN